MKEYVDINGISYAEFKEEVESSEWSGIDVNNDISLGEYHILVKPSTYSNGCIDAIYFNALYNKFIMNNVDMFDIIDMLDDEKKKSLCEFADIHEDLKKYAEECPANFLNDIDSYFGLHQYV